jgi:hypothetical protein
MASDMEVHMKQSCVTEFLHVEKTALIDIQRRLLNVYGDQTVDVRTMRWRMVRFSIGDSDVRDSPRSEQSCTAVSPWWRVPRSAHLRKSVVYDQGTLYGAECGLQCIGNHVGNVGVSQSLCHVGPRDAHTGT